MKIVSSTLQMASSHASLQQHEVRERLSMWAGDRPVRREQTAPPAQDRSHDRVRLSDAGKAAAAKDASAPASDDESGDSDPRLKLIRSLIELLTGRRIDVFDAHDIKTDAPDTPTATAPPPAETQAPPAGWGISYDRHESYSEAELTTFSASGKVTTADGREIDFSLQLSMSRSYHTESDVSLRLGDAAKKTDPLVLNFSGTAAQLTDQRFAFDLNADGQAEQINFVAPGSGFLVFDRNRDGKINDGRELFGPTTNDGFQELGALDSDRNGWIDENDPAFNQLQIWTRTDDGNDQLQSLAAAGVGAVSLSRVSSHFDIKNNDNRLLGHIRNSGIFLQESGAAGTIQQIDLTA
ncbi:MAG TPA: VCBS repeat-containing protein [Azonexus sp.]|nr:VCBS repeat-containing protein [Azonexus sp.]